MKISLTFDNGPHPVVTPFVLNILREQSIKATFFHIGKNLENPDAATLITAILEDGHSIGNHSYHHSMPLGKFSPSEAVREIATVQDKFAELGFKPTLFRPCGGGGKLDHHLMHPSALQYLQENRMTCVLWNCVPEDWIDPKGWCDRALTDIEQRPWSVVVIHDIENRGMEDLARFIEGAKNKGASFTLDFPAECVPLKNGRLQWDMSALMPQK
jgi:peptidoglycan/xylan/chitin deacetylase (PgdA/CDA1 family)